MVNTWGWYREPTDLMEHIAQLKLYYLESEAKEKLLLVAEHIDNPLKLKELEEEWLYGSRSKKPPSKFSRHVSRALGWEWE